jgi:hypothetical protein
MERATILGRQGPQPFGGEAAIGALDALRAYSIEASRQLFMEDVTGSLAPGKYADLAVWEHDFEALSPAEVRENRCLMTLVGGREVYRGPDL